MQRPSLPPPGSPLAPKYWRNETSGVLHIAVEEYLLTPTKMTVRSVALMRAYLIQWIESPVWNMPGGDAECERELARLREAVGRIQSVQQIDEWIHAALGIGIDPL